MTYNLTLHLAGDKDAYIAAQTTSSISLVGVYSKENYMIVFRLGEMPRVGDGFVVINEIGSYWPEDQKMILDLKEEGETSTVKYGIKMRIYAPITILSITNLQGGDWHRDIVSRDQIPLRKEILDRDDLIFIFEREKNKAKKFEYAAIPKKMDIRLGVIRFICTAYIRVNYPSNIKRFRIDHGMKSC